MSRRAGSLGNVLPVQVVEPDGLVVTDDGRYVRILECERLPNAITADAVAQARIGRALAEICTSLPDEQSLSIYAQTDPIPVKEALAEDRRRVALSCDHDRATGREDLATVREWLLAAQKQSVVEAAGSEQPAVAARWWIAITHRPVEDDLRARFAGALRPGGRPVAWRVHQRAAAESLRQAEQLCGQLAGIAIEPWVLDGVQTLALLWERFHPAARELPDMDLLKAATGIASATTAEEAGAARQRILEAVCSGSPAGIDARDPRHLKHADGTLEEILHLGTPPVQTTLWWLMHLLACPLPVTVAVHISVGNRQRVRARQRRRWRRLRAAVDYKHRRSQLVGAEEHEALAEAEQLDAELASEVGATVYTVGVLAAIRDPRGKVEPFEHTVKAVAREFQAHTGARVLRGRWLCQPGLVSTIPVGVDRLRATRSYAQRNIAHCLPLTSSSCGSPTGLILGFADPGGTLERLDPFDPLYTRHVTLAIGPSGGGKTVTINALLERAISQGMRGWVIDRSSTATERGDRGQGHYEMLLGLIPGSRRVQVGSPHGDVICPWDVPDSAEVPPEKEQFLLALHALLIGDHRGGEERTLSALEESFLLSGIRAVYDRCADSGERPRETMLRDELDRRAGDVRSDGALSDALRSLIVRLEPYCEGGAFAHLADAPSSVGDEATLTLFDIAGLPDRLVAPMILGVIDHIEGQIQRTRALRVTGALDDQGAWAGRRFLVVEEGWKLTSSAAAGAWLNEYARRSRHYALWLIFVSQFFRDLATPQGQALLENKAIALCFQNDEDDLRHARGALGLSDVDIEQITQLSTRPGLYSSTYMISPRGRGTIRQLLGDLEYWICCSDPEHDQPRRAAALNAADGDHWAALRLLCTPDWQEHHRDRSAA
jgi:hypothetical protein